MQKALTCNDARYSYCPCIDFGDAFDEESCRYFLLEVGQRIVPCYPFTYGIYEVYATIIEQYGLERAADATSILQELLEDEQNASGVGDDGDIWRSWRHGWRHRNDDAAHPFIPRVGRIILPSPTPVYLRRWKAENFLRQHRQERLYVGSKTGHKCAELDTSSLIVEGTQHLRHSLASCHEHTPSRRRSVHVEMNEFDRSESQPLEDSVPSFISLSQFPIPPMNTSFLEAFQESSKQVEDPKPTTDNVSVIVDSNLPSYVYHTGSRAEVEGFPYANQLLQGRSKADSSVTENVTQETTNQLGDPATRFNKRSENRKARLIDGKIFNIGSKITKPSHRNSSISNEASLDNSIPLPIEENQVPIQQHKQARDSWFQDLRHNLFKQRPASTINRHLRHKSVPVVSQAKSFLCTRMPSPRLTRPKELTRSNTVQRFGFDGAHDSPAADSVGSVNLNKPLPLSPDVLLKTRQHIARSKSFSSINQGIYQKPPSTPSTESSGFSTKSSKLNFHDITRNLLASNAPSAVGLSAFKEGGRGNESQPREGQPNQLFAGTYQSVSTRNSMDEQTRTYSPAIPMLPIDLRNTHATTGSSALGNIPHSQSAPGLRWRPKVPNLAGKQLSSQSDLQDTRLEREVGTNDHETRGRHSRTSDTKKEASNSYASAKQETKRSRSPIKKLFGLSRNQASGDTSDEAPSASKTPKSIKNSSIKKWGDRFRYGFLTPDEEQRRNEELIETHIDPDTPPSCNSTFPISLEPPTQAKLQSEIELYITVTANRFLMKEAKSGRISADSVAKLRDRWAKMNRPQVVEFHYDQMCQHDLIYTNIESVKFCGDAARDPNQIHSTMTGWRVMAREMSVRTFCCPDSVLRKHLHDAHRVLELLGAPLVTFLAYENMQIKSLQMIAQRQKERIDMKHANGHGRSFSDGARVPSDTDFVYEPEYTSESFQLDRVRLSPSPSPAPGSGPRYKARKATGAEGAIMSLPLPPSRMRLRPQEQTSYQNDNETLRGINKAIPEKPESLLL